MLLHVGCWQFTTWSPLLWQLQEGGGVVNPVLQTRGVKLPGKRFQMQSPKSTLPHYRLPSLSYQDYTLLFEDPFWWAVVAREPSRPVLLLPSCVILPKWAKLSFKMGRYPLCQVLKKPGQQSLCKVPRRDLALDMHALNVGSAHVSLTSFSKFLSDAPSSKAARFR